MTRPPAFTASCLAAALLWVAAAPRAANAMIVLSWRADSAVVCLGGEIGVRLYAVSDVTSASDAFVAANVYFSWDSEYLEFLGIDNTDSTIGPDGRSELLFPDVFCGMNELLLPADGNGIYLVTAPLSGPLQAPPQGALLTTFRFRGRAPAAVARINVMRQAPDCLPTVVYDDLVPNNNVIHPVLGYGSLNLQVGCGVPTQACCFPDSSCANLPTAGCSSQGGTPQGVATTCLTVSCLRPCLCLADVNRDDAANALDLKPFVDCLLGRGGDCTCADLNQNGRTDPGDVSAFISRLLMPAACSP